MVFRVGARVDDKAQLALRELVVPGRAGLGMLGWHGLNNLMKYVVVLAN